MVQRCTVYGPKDGEDPKKLNPCDYLHLLKFYALLCFDAQGEGMLDLCHLGDGVSHLYYLRRYIPSGEDQMHPGWFLFANEGGNLLSR